MSEFLYAEIHVTDETVELRWLYDDKKYALKMGHEMLDVLGVEDGQKPAILTEALVFDVDSGDGTFWDAS
jgi:hypothetical protein